MVSHKDMHERAGHVVSKLKKHDAKRPLEQPFLLRRVQNEFDKPAACQIVPAPVGLSQKEGWGFFLKMVKKIEASSKKNPTPLGVFPRSHCTFCNFEIFDHDPQLDMKFWNP